MDRTEMGAVPLGAASWPVRGLPYQAIPEGVKAPLRKGRGATVRRRGAAQVVMAVRRRERRGWQYNVAWTYFRVMFPRIGDGALDRLCTLAVMYLNEPEYFK